MLGLLREGVDYVSNLELSKSTKSISLLLLSFYYCDSTLNLVIL